MFSRHHDITDQSPDAYNRFSIVFLFLLSTLLMLRQLASSSYFTVIITDAFIYPSWAWQFNEALKEGILYPRWLPLDFWGYGSPTFLLYPPLAYYLVAFFNMFADSIITAMNLVKFTALFFSGVGVYFLVKEFYPARAALQSAVFCIILPFNIALMYLFGSFAAMVSCLWFAPILLFEYRFCKNGEFKYLIYSGACYGGLILTHLITAYMFTFVIVAFAIYMSIITKRARDLVIIPAILLTGLTLSAAYILPVVFERKYVNIEIFTKNIESIYSNQFILPDLTARFPPKSFWPLYYDSIVLHTVIFCLFLLLFLVRSSKSKEFEKSSVTYSVNKFILITAVCSILLMFGVSTFLWEIIPFFKNILFPYRWLHITAFATSFMSASAFVSVNKNTQTKKTRILLPALIFLSCLTLDLFFTNVALSNNKKELLPALAVNIILEHLPHGVRIDVLEKKHGAGDKSGFTIHGGGCARVVSWKSTDRVLDVNADGPLVVRFRTFNFPGWNAYVDGAHAEISPEADTLAIMVNVPPGNHRLELVFKDTPVRRYAKLISLVSFILLSTYLVTAQVLKLKE